MFGKRRDEDYDDYNERYAAKYDDDYIAPSKEYRTECSHSHEQAYENINNVRECDHSHEQTYNDADTEQKPYDNYVSLESIFEPMLAPGEHLLWAGGKKDASKRRNADYKLIIVAAILFFAGGAFSIFICLLGMILFTVSICLLIRANASTYAITDMRVIVVKNGGNTSIPLDWILNVSHSSGGSSGGYLILALTHPVMMNGTGLQSSNRFVMYNIQDAPRVKRILDDAVMGIRISQKRR